VVLRGLHGEVTLAVQLMSARDAVVFLEPEALKVRSVPRAASARRRGRGAGRVRSVRGRSRSGRWAVRGRAGRGVCT